MDVESFTVHLLNQITFEVENYELGIYKFLYNKNWLTLLMNLI